MVHDAKNMLLPETAKYFQEKAMIASKPPDTLYYTCYLATIYFQENEFESP